MHGPQKGNSRVLLSYYDTLINFCLWECHTVHLHGSVQGGVFVYRADILMNVQGLSYSTLFTVQGVYVCTEPLY